MYSITERTAVAKRYRRCDRSNGAVENGGPQAGDAVGQYLITECLEDNQTGRVFSARHRLLGSRVRLIVFHKHLLAASGLEKRVRTRAVVAATLQHPHIVPTTDMFETPDHLVYVQAVDRVSSCADHLEKDGPFSWAEACRIMQDVASALDYCHRKGILHLNVRPETIFMRDDGTVYLNHFFAVESPGPVSTNGSRPHRGNGVEQPPEVTAGQPVTPAADIWGIGLSLFSLVAGHSPFGGYGDSHDGAVSLHAVDSDVPRDIDLLLAKLLAPVKESRYESAAEVRDQLSMLLEEEDAATLPPPFLDITIMVGPPEEYRLGDFVISESIGSGSYGDVYKASRRGGTKIYALKVLRKEFSNRFRYVSRFQRECEALQRVSHPGVVRIHENGRIDGRPYLVMELVPGHDLRERMNVEGRIGGQEALTIAANLAEALGVVHEAGVIHRDLKPHNILMGEHGPVITDFGSAHVRDTVRCTRTGEIIGSVAYMAPEQLEAGSLGPETDLYGLGVVLYQMLTGELPFEDDNPYRIFELIRTEPAPRLESKGVEGGAAIDVILDQLLAKDPRDRYADGKALAALLRQVRDELD